MASLLATPAISVRSPKLAPAAAPGMAAVPLRVR
jgi:hypothetical protein